MLNRFTEASKQWQSMRDLTSKSLIVTKTACHQDSTVESSIGCSFQITELRAESISNESSEDYIEILPEIKR